MSESRRQTEKHREMLMHGECRVVVCGCEAMSANCGDEEEGTVLADNRNTGVQIAECKKCGLKDRNWVRSVGEKEDKWS